MPQNNLRVIYSNAANKGTVEASSQGAYTPSTNLLNDSKTGIWRTIPASSGNVSAKLLVTFIEDTTIGGAVLPYTNLSKAATIRVRAFKDAFPVLGGSVDSPTVTLTGSTLMGDSGTILAGNYDVEPALSNLTGVSKYSFGGYRSARAWFSTNVVCTSVLIEISDVNEDFFIEASKLVVGQFWSPKFNIGLGSGMAYNDLTTIGRMDSGNQEINVGPRFKTLNFELKWLDEQDRNTMRQLLQRNGKSVPIFVSLFPQLPSVAAATPTELDLEATYSIYGRLSEIQALINSNYTIYSNTLQVEEI